MTGTAIAAARHGNASAGQLPAGAYGSRPIVNTMRPEPPAGMAHQSLPSFEDHPHSNYGSVWAALHQRFDATPIKRAALNAE